MATKKDKLKFIAKLIANNRITVPSVSIQVLDLKEGDVIEVEIKKVVKKQEGEVVA